MKKIICAILTVILSVLVVSCKSQIDYTVYVSELRTNIYQGEKDDVKLIMYTGLREDPYIADGYVGQIKNFVTVRLVSVPESADGVTVSLKYGKESIDGTFEYHPIGGKYVAQFEVDTLPTEPTISATVNVGGEDVVINLATLKNSECIEYKQAIASVKKYDEKIFSELFDTNQVKAEIHIRLLSDGEKNYYYVGVVDKDCNSYAYLVDALSGITIAKK